MGSGGRSSGAEDADGDVKLSALGKVFSNLTTETMGLRRNVSFNNASAFPAMPRGQISNSSSSLSLGGKPASHGMALHEHAEPIFSTKRLAVVMVGLPARGKFFDPENEQGRSARWKLAQETMHEMISWLLEENGHVAVFDATNTTIERRAKVFQGLDSVGVRVLFLESICDDQTVVERNIHATKLFSPDYVGADPEEAVKDFTNRIANYAKSYDTVGETESEKAYSYLKVIDVGEKMVLNRIDGFVQGKIVSYLMNTHIMPRTIYLSRHGESKWNVTGQLGGDPSLTERGKAYAVKLAEFMNEEFTQKGEPLPLVWTSQLRRTRQTVELVPTVNVCWHALHEIDAGVCEGMTYQQIKEEMPNVAQARKSDKLRYRYPMGESYVDVIQRLEPVLLELERQREPVLIVAHNAIIRAIFSYYMGVSQEECPNLDIPLHTVFKIKPRAYKCDCERVQIPVENTYNNKTPDPSPENSPVVQSSDDLHQYREAEDGGALTPPASRDTRVRSYLDPHGNLRID